MKLLTPSSTRHHLRPSIRIGLRRLIFAVAVLLLMSPANVQARVRLGSICNVYGQQEVRLTGLGLVVGLNGTGDGGKNLPTIRALASALKLLNNPVTSATELQNASNVAIVLVEATVPRTGLQRGQKIDCYVSSIMGAKSLRGGRLLTTPLETADIKNNTAVALSSGALYIEDVTVPTTARIPGGVTLRENFMSLFVTKQDDKHVVTLLLDAEHAGFQGASEVSRVVNAEFSFEASGREVAHAVGPGVVQVEIPQQYRDSAVDFVAKILEIGIEQPRTHAKVVINAKTGTVIVTGEVEISPVVISHRNLTVEIGNGFNDQPSSRFVAVADNAETGPRQLRDLVDALNQLRVSTSEIIEIIRELHASGKIHAVVIEK